MGLGQTAVCLDGMWVRTDAELVEMYQRRVAAHGFSGRTMFYRDERQHQSKVEQYLKLLRSTVGPGESLLDIGCGYGSLAPHLPDLRYVGIDIVPEMVAHARRVHPQREFRVQNVADCTDTFDWCVLLGVVNAVPDPWRVLRLSWQRCARGLLVDFIDQEKLNPPVANLNRFDLGECRSILTQLGAHSIEMHTTANVWTVFLARKT
jgi:SAM-dependent methyltransferase